LKNAFGVFQDACYQKKNCAVAQFFSALLQRRA